MMKDFFKLLKNLDKGERELINVPVTDIDNILCDITSLGGGNSFKINVVHAATNTVIDICCDLNHIATIIQWCYYHDTDSVSVKNKVVRFPGVAYVHSNILVHPDVEYCSN